jgi:UTP--glucose-1-phosphate uridylyltransferase
MHPVKKAVIPAAGLGTRFLPATKAVPKEMLPIVDVPTLQLVVEEAMGAGIEEIVLVTGRGKSSLEDHFDISFELERTLQDRGKLDLLRSIERISRMVRLCSVRQKEPLGLGHAVLAARHVAGEEPVAVLLGDDLFDTGEGRPAIGQLCDLYQRTGKGVVALLEVLPEDVSLYGVAAGEHTTDGLFAVDSFVEKPQPESAPSRLAVVGRYVLPSEIWPILERTPPGKNGEIQLTDALCTLAQTQGCFGLTVKGIRHDAGDRLGYLGANLAYALKRPELRAPLLSLMRRLIEEHS